MDKEVVGKRRYDGNGYGQSSLLLGYNEKKQ